MNDFAHRNWKIYDQYIKVYRLLLRWDDCLRAAIDDNGGNMVEVVTGSLDADEKCIAKALLAKGFSNQDIQYLINIGRKVTVNSGRITKVKEDVKQSAADDQEVDIFLRRKETYNPITGLNLVDDERLIRAREAMCLAVQIFNSPSTYFKTELFTVLANIAWTYLMHEHYIRKGDQIINEHGKTLALSVLIQRSDCPLSEGIKNNLNAIKEIRDEVEHHLFGRSDENWLPLFQACCLNFDKILCQLFGKKVSIQNELSVALQFGKLDINSFSILNNYDIPENIKSLDESLKSQISTEESEDLEYQFKVVYTLVSSSKGQSHLQFLSPESAEGQEVKNVLIKPKHIEKDYPFKPMDVCKEVELRIGKKFTANSHTLAWKEYKVRPPSKDQNPQNTDKRYCIYHTLYKSYSYNQKWIDLLVHQNNKK